MGLIKAGLGSVSTVLADQWKEYFICDSLSSDILVAKGVKKTSSKSSNTKGSDNVISNGSIITISAGQCAIIVDQGKIAEVCSEPGEFKYDSSTEPSIFAGNLSESIIDTFKNIGKRFTFGGETPKDQRVYYINLKEIMGNKYGTANPVPFRVVDTNIGLDIDISVRCNGEFTYHITNPLLFYANVVGNTSSNFNRSSIDSILKTELLTSLQPAFAKISAMGIRYSAIPGHTEELANTLNDILSSKWKEVRGIEIKSFGVNSIVASKEDEDMIKELQKTAVLRNANMAAATLTQAQADAMRNASSNEAGAMMGFAGFNMAQTAGGGVNTSALFAMGAEQERANLQNTQNQSKEPTWNCDCGHTNSGKFCMECGTKAKVTNEWSCSCGTKNKGKFCMECGTPNAIAYACDKCGFEPADAKNPPKFCPECGDVFDDNDRK